MVHQTITERPPNLTVGCRCRKEKTKKTLGMETARPRFDRCQKTVQTRTHQRRPQYSKTPQVCLSSLGPHSFLCSMLKGRRSGFFLAALPRYPEHVDSGQQFLGSSKPFWPHQLSLLEDSVPQISWPYGKSSQLAVDNLGMVKCFSCLHS